MMVPKLIEARYTAGSRVWLRFEDGVEGEVDLEKELWGEVFEPLKDHVTFRGFRLDDELDTLVWPNGADFAPEFLYQQLRPNKPVAAGGAHAPLLNGPVRYQQQRREDVHAD